MKNTYIIPETERDTIVKAFARYQKKAQAYGQAVSVSFGDPYAKRVGIYVADEINHCKRKVDDCMIEVFNVELHADVIRKGGYTVVAKLEHMDGGNLVYALCGEVNPAWRSIAPRCEHCGGSHNQKTTFIVHDEQGNEKQVGSTCLKDYTGIHPAAILSLKELHDILIDEDVDRSSLSDAPKCRVYDALRVLALAIRLYKAYGYTPSSRECSNKERLERLVFGREEPTVSELAEAEQIAKAVKAMDVETAAGYLLDSVHHLLVSAYCKRSHFGFIAYAPLAYLRYTEAQAREAEAKRRTEAEAASSVHVGSVGERLIIDIADMKLLTSWAGDYGFTYMYKFIDKAGCVYIWYGSKTIAKTDKIKATIKAHTERDGIKQTIITRCKAA